MSYDVRILFRLSNKSILYGSGVVFLIHFLAYSTIFIVFRILNRGNVVHLRERASFL